MMKRSEFFDLCKCARWAGVMTPLLALMMMMMIGGPACKTTMDDQAGGSEGPGMTGKDITKGKMIGIKVYNSPEAGKGEFDTWEKVFDAWESMGVNTVFTIPETAETEEFQAEFEERDMKLYLILQIFFYWGVDEEEPELCSINAEGECAKQDWVTFACPSRESYRERKLDAIEGWVEGIEPDGISIDFIRHYQFWEKVYPETKAEDLVQTCFDDACMERFQEETEIKIPESEAEPESRAAWIQDNQMDDWVEWKAGLITSMVEQIVERAKSVDKDIKTNAHLVPWRRDDWDGAILSVIGQDFAAIAEHVDAVSPMAYSHMLHRDPEWIESVLADVETQIDDGVKIIPSVQVDQYEEYDDPEMSEDDFQKIMEESLAGPSDGVIWFNWPLFEANEDRRAAVRKFLLGLD